MLNLCLRSVSALGSNSLKALFPLSDGLIYDTAKVSLFDSLRTLRYLKKQVRSLVLPGILVFSVISVVSIVSPKTAFATAGINQELSFEGKIVSSTGTNITDGNYNTEFIIYTGCTNEPASNTGCTAVWTEDYLTSNSTYASTLPVAFTSGTFQVNLGSICTFSGSSCEGNTNSAINWDTYPLYVSINVGTTAVCAAGFSTCGGGTGAMNPYILLTSSPYAMNANNANQLGGVAAANFVQLSPGSQQTGNINISGTITSGAINGQTIAGAASFGTSVTAPSLIANTGVYTGASSGTERLDSSGNLVSIGNITGAGAVSFATGGATALSLDTGGGAAINIAGTNATSIVIGGNTTATITEKVANSSATAFTLQTAGGTDLLVADSTGSRLYVGGSAGSSTPILLVLGVKNTSGDPTETDGSMYYNSTNNRFRCGENGAFVNCIGGTMTTNTSATSAVNTCTTACAAFGATASLPANFCVAGRVIHVVAKGVLSTDSVTAPKLGAWGVYIGSNASTKTSDTLIGGASPTSASLSLSLTNTQWSVDYTIICDTTGSSGTVTGEGSITFVASSTTTTTETTLPMNASATTTLNTTTPQTIYLFPAWSVSSSTDTATLEQFIVSTQ
jgi:hypothetical protein